MSLVPDYLDGPVAIAWHDAAIVTCNRRPAE